MRYNSIKDVNIIYDVPNLTELQLSNNQIKHITAIRNLTRLKMINITNPNPDLKSRQNKLSRLENLSNHANLEVIRVSGNPISSFSGLENLNRLELICCIQEKELPANFEAVWKPYFDNIGFKLTHTEDVLDSILVRRRKHPALKFKVSKYLSLKLKEDGETIIKVNGKDFIICKALLFQIPVENIELYDESESIDEIVESVEILEDEISQETEFWGHCSILEGWYKEDYKTELLSYHIAFPLLKKLTEAGDPKAKRVFKQEIAKRYESGFPAVVEYLVQGGYLNYLDTDELDSLRQD